MRFKDRVSPTLCELSNVFESFAVETLGEVIGQLVSCGDLQDLDVAVGDMVPEEVPLDLEVLGPISDALLGCEEQGAVVVLKDSAADS